VNIIGDMFQLLREFQFEPMNKLEGKKRRKLKGERERERERACLEY
jgi:hypothetical protein